MSKEDVSMTGLVLFMLTGLLICMDVQEIQDKRDRRAA
jgi:hypothetical protein